METDGGESVAGFSGVEIVYREAERDWNGKAEVIREVNAMFRAKYDETAVESTTGTLAETSVKGNGRAKEGVKGKSKI